MSILQNKRRLAFCGAAFCLLLLGVLAAVGIWQAARIEGLEVRVLDVGQGDATLIRTAKASLLIDAGPNSAEETLYAMLAALGVERLDVVIFTHPDEDHIGGGDYLLARIPVGTVYLAPVAGAEASVERLYETLADSGASVRIGTAGETFALGEAVVTLLAPLAAHDDANDASIVTRITYGETAMLFMGDAGFSVEEALVAGSEALQADWIKLGHHGANSSTSEALLDAVQPRHAAISCGYANAYGHPSRRVIDALTARGIEIGRTDREGMLVYRSDGKRLWRD